MTAQTAQTADQDMMDLVNQPIAFMDLTEAEQAEARRLARRLARHGWPQAYMAYGGLTPQMYHAVQTVRYLAPDDAPVHAFVDQEYDRRRQMSAEAREAYVGRWQSVAATQARYTLRGYYALAAKLGARQTRKLGNNTYLRRLAPTRLGQPDRLAVSLHDTDILTFTLSEDGTREYVTLDSGGWITDTTYRRMVEYLPYGLSLDRYTVPARFVERGADLPGDESAAFDRKEEQMQAWGNSLSNPYAIAFAARSASRTARALWTVTDQAGTRHSFGDGMHVNCQALNYTS